MIPWHTPRIRLLGLIIVAVFVAECENATKSSSRSNRPSDGGEGDLAYIVEEEIDGSQAKVIQGGKTRMSFDAGVVGQRTMVRLKRTSIDDLDDAASVAELKSLGEVVSIGIFDPVTKRYLSSDDIGEFRFETEVSGVDDPENLRLVIITNPNSPEQDSVLIDDLEFEEDGSVRLVNSTLRGLAGAKLRLTNAVIFVTEVTASTVTRLPTKTSNQVTTAGGGSVDTGSSDGGDSGDGGGDTSDPVLFKSRLA